MVENVSIIFCDKIKLKDFKIITAENNIRKRRKKISRQMNIFVKKQKTLVQFIFNTSERCIEGIKVLG